MPAGLDLSSIAISAATLTETAHSLWRRAEGGSHTDRIPSPCNRPIGCVLPNSSAIARFRARSGASQIKLPLEVLGDGHRTRQLLFQVLVVFVTEAVGGDVGAGFGIANILHLVGVLFDADFAEIAPGAQDCRHGLVTYRKEVS